MTNKTTAILTAIKACLVSAGISSVYIYPDHKAGQNFPMAVIAEGDKDMVTEPGNRVRIIQSISIFITENKLTDRQKVMADLEAAVWTQLLSDHTLGGNVDNTQPVSTRMGDIYRNLDEIVSGYKGNVTVRELTLNLFYCDTRS